MTRQVDIIQGRAESLAALNLYLLRLPPGFRKRTIMALRDGGVLSDVATGVLIETHGLEAA